MSSPCAFSPTLPTATVSTQTSTVSRLDQRGMLAVFDLAVAVRRVSLRWAAQVQQRRTLPKLPLQANFYPMTSAAFLQDSASRWTLLSAQSQGVASLKQGEAVRLPPRPPLARVPASASGLGHRFHACAGELEVMLDRRLQQDDNRGLGQGVTDNKLTASLYQLLVEERRGGAQVRRRASA